jgi:hypothetical protein
LTHWRGRIARTVAGIRLRRTATSVDWDIKTLHYRPHSSSSGDREQVDITLERVRINPRAASADIARAAPHGDPPAASVDIARAAPHTWHLLAAVAALLGCLLAGCSAGHSSDFNTPPPAASPTRPPSIPSGGVTLAELGYLNGPAQQFSLPSSAVIRAKVDQPNNVVAVVSSPSPVELSSYLRRALPAAGFMIIADSPATNTMTFTGHGWSGSYTGDERASAVLLRPL